MELKKACFADIEQIMELLVEGRTSLASLGIDQWQGDYPHRGIIESDILHEESYIVVDEHGRSKATAMIGLRDEPDYRTIQNGDWLTVSALEMPCYIVVHRVAVSTEKKQSGIGSLILDGAALVAKKHGCASVRIDTHPGNTPMQRLLQKKGYTQCGEIVISHAEEANPKRYAYEKLV